MCEEYRDVGAATILLLQQQLAFVFIWEFNGTPPIGLKPQVLNFSSAASSLPFLSLLTFEMRINVGEGEPQLVYVYTFYSFEQHTSSFLSSSNDVN